MTATLPALTAAAGAIAGGIVDARTGFIPNALTRASLATALVLALLRGDGVVAAAGASCCGGAILFLHVATRGRGIGLGDVKLAAAVGAGLGPAGGALALALAFVGGGAVASWLLASKRSRRGDTLAFAPYIAGGTVLTLIAEASR